MMRSSRKSGVRTRKKPSIFMIQRHLMLSNPKNKVLDTDALVRRRPNPHKTVGLANIPFSAPKKTTSSPTKMSLFGVQQQLTGARRALGIGGRHQNASQIKKSPSEVASGSDKHHMSIFSVHRQIATVKRLAGHGHHSQPEPKTTSQPTSSIFSVTRQVTTMKKLLKNKAGDNETTTTTTASQSASQQISQSASSLFLVSRQVATMKKMIRNKAGDQEETTKKETLSPAPPRTNTTPSLFSVQRQVLAVKRVFGKTLETNRANSQKQEQEQRVHVRQAMSTPNMFALQRQAMMIKKIFGQDKAASTKRASVTERDVRSSLKKKDSFTRKDSLTSKPGDLPSTSAKRDFFGIHRQMIMFKKTLGIASSQHVTASAKPAASSKMADVVSKTTRVMSLMNLSADAEERKQDFLRHRALVQYRSRVLGASQSARIFCGRGTLIPLALMGDWLHLETILKKTMKNDERLHSVDPETGESLLMLACQDHRLIMVERLLELGADPNLQANDGRTALHYAAEYCQDDIIKVLLEKKADPNICGGINQQLPIHTLLIRPDVPTAGLVLLRATSRECRLKKDGLGYLPVAYAVDSGYFNIVRECLSIDCKEQLKWRHDTTGSNLVHIATERADLKLLNYLLGDMNCNVNVQDAHGATPLHLATAQADEMTLRLLHSFGANPNVIDEFEQTPVHIAAEQGYALLVDILVNTFRAKVHLRTKDGSTLMHQVAYKGFVETAEVFIKRGVSLRMPNKKGYLALHIATEKGHTEMVKLLITKGSPVDQRTRSGYTPLHLAVLNRHPEIIQILLGLGAKVDMKGGPNEEAPLHIAARLVGGFECAEMLIKSGANVNIQNGDRDEVPLHLSARYGFLGIVSMLLEEDGDPAKRSCIGENTLHIAVRNCHFAVVQKLIEFMIEKHSKKAAETLINMPNNEGETAFHNACVLPMKSKFFILSEEVKIVKILLSNGANISARTVETLDNCVHYCAKFGNPNILRQIVRYIGHEFSHACNQRNSAGRSVLMVACEQGHGGVTETLLKNGARADIFDEQGKAALHLAAENGHARCCEILLNYKAFVNVKSRLGFTPLHFAAEKGHVPVLKLLIQKHNAFVNALSLVKKTPLHLAAEAGQMEILPLLMSLGANPNAVDELGQTPLHLAAANDHARVIRYFIKTHPELITSVSKNGMNCAHTAASNGATSVIKELMHYNKALVVASKIVGSSHVQESSKDSLPLHLAVSGGYSDLVRLLIDAGSSAKAENFEGMSAIHLAAKEGNVSVLLAIPSKDALKIYSQKNGMSPIHVAAFYGNAEFVREILLYVDANSKTQAPLSASSVSDPALRHLIASDIGLTPLHLASFSGDTNVVRQLLNVAGVETDVPTAILGRVPMHLATSNGHLPVVSILMSRSTGLLNVKDNKGRMPLHVASENGHNEMVSTLLGQGADINARDEDGCTALHYATKGGYFSLVRLLVEGGAALGVKTTEEKTALMLAASGGHIEVLSYLIKKDHNTQELMAESRFLLDLMLCGKTNNNLSIDEFVDNSEAPLFTAAHLANLYRQLVFKERERAKDLSDIGRYLEHTATELLGIAATLAPPASILQAIDNKGNQFLDMALEDNLKEVVEQAAVQKYLSEVWNGKLKNWSSKWLTLLFLGFLIFPPMWCYYCLPLAACHRYYHIPIIKFLALLVSHIYFIGILIVIAAMPIDPILFRKDYIPTWYELVCLIWVSGMLVSELTSQSSRSGLAMLRPLIVVFSTLACAFQGAAIYNDDGTIDGRTFALTLMYNRNFMLSLALFAAIILTLDFLLIHHLFGEFGIVISAVFKDLIVFLVVVMIFVFAFSFQICCLYAPVKNSAFGRIKMAAIAARSNNTTTVQPNPTTPMARAVPIAVKQANATKIAENSENFSNSTASFNFTQGSYWNETARFVLTLNANATNDTTNSTRTVKKKMCKVRKHGERSTGWKKLKTMVDNRTQPEDDEEEPPMNNKNPFMLLHIVVMLYFALFGMIQLSTFPPIKDGPEWSRFLIEGYFAAYMMVTSIILIPLLIAMLTETYIRIHQRSDIEWKFGRAKLIRSMIKLTAAPPPLNIFVRVFYYIIALKRYGKGMFTIYAQYFITEIENEGASFTEGHSTAGDSQSKTTPRRTGADKSALGSLHRKLLVTQLLKCMPCLTQRTEVASKSATPRPPGQVAPAKIELDGPQRIEDVIDWKAVIRRYRNVADSSSSENKPEDQTGGAEGSNKEGNEQKQE